MSMLHRSFRQLTAALLGLLLCVDAQAATPTSETWRFTHSMALSGPEAQPPPDDSGLQGQQLVFEDRRLRGPHPFGGDSGCAKSSRMQAITLPLEGLFEGSLPEPQKLNAERLGLATFPVQARRITCTNASFDFVQADANTLLTVLDGRVWSLSNTAGAQAPPNTRMGVVQAVLESHFASDRAFLEPQLQPLKPWLSKRMQKAVKTYFARPRPKDEVPPINTDAFTSSQEGPPRFAVERAEKREGKNVVWVRIADAYSQWYLRYDLVKEGKTWKLDDILNLHEDARGLRSILEND